MVVNQMFLFVGMTGFEPATTRPPDAYSNRAELHPAPFSSAKVHKKQEIQTFLLVLFSWCYKKWGNVYSNTVYMVLLS